jgi:hypothetical protein
MQIDESYYRQLLLILYDREPLLPEKLKKDLIYRNINNYIKSRRKKIKTMHRKYPRIPECLTAHYKLQQKRLRPEKLQCYVPPV